MLRGCTHTLLPEHLGTGLVLRLAEHGIVVIIVDLVLLQLLLLL